MTTIEMLRPGDIIEQKDGRARFIVIAGWSQRWTAPTDQGKVDHGWTVHASHWFYRHWWSRCWSRYTPTMELHSAEIEFMLSTGWRIVRLSGAAQ